MRHARLLPAAVLAMAMLAGSCTLTAQSATGPETSTSEAIPSVSDSASLSASEVSPPASAASTSASSAASTKASAAATTKAETKAGILAPISRPFPAGNAWNTAITSKAVDPLSAAIISSIGTSTTLHMDFGANWNGGPFGIPYVVVVQPSTGKLYELFDAHPNADGSWRAGSGAIFNLATGADRPAGWTSADAAGLPILPGLVRYDEVASGVINHAIRFTVANTRKAYVAPARHFASSKTATSLPPMGTRVRLKASFDISGYPQQARVILQAMKAYGLIVADNGSNWYVSGTPDSRWSDDQLNTLKRVPGSAFDVVALGAVTSG